jgi:SARP family transcriptional regulator, regulator of embCAB operon
MIEQQWEVQLIGGWQLRCGQSRPNVAPRQQRLIAALALYGGQSRPFIAELLWPGSNCAMGSLRESIWIISHELEGLLFTSSGWVAIAEGVKVDVLAIRKQAARSIARPEMLLEHDVLEQLHYGELLPGWDDYWIIAEREQWRFLRVMVFECMARRLLDQGNSHAAMEAARSAIAIESTRETAQQLVLRVLLSEGNHAEALQAYREFSAKYRSEFEWPPVETEPDRLS